MSSSRSTVKGKGKAVLRPSQIQLEGFDESPLWNHVKVTGGAALVEVTIGIGCAITATRSLLKVAEIRFASSIVMARRLRDVKLALEKMVMDSSWKTYQGDGKSPIEIKAQEVKQYIVNDTWWDKLEFFLSFTEPLMDMLRAADTDAPVLHLIYDMWDTMIEKVKLIIFEQEGENLITGGDKFDIDGHALTELAELSLGEPKIEAVTFDDNVER
ncbi:hypothetical protein RJ640_015571 [Escallonia rubra]|uniref:Uncharacterized protein n=1 Tax=Escallonia rubra TaxID=112253 RepID=A0AA88QZS7_9ASTE|nr:hypothetical protein RJ640_015571 [Escallonia rubra]